MLLNEIRHPMGDDTGLSAAGAGEDQQGPLDMADGIRLLRVQTLEQIHGGGNSV